MLPVVLRFTHPVWGFVLPAVLALLAVLSARMWFQSRRAASRSASALLALAVLLCAGAALQALRRPFVPSPLVVHAYGVFLCAGLLAAWGLAGYAVKTRALPRGHLPGAFVATAVAALLGARLLFVLTVPIEGWREALAVHRGGLSLWGGLLAGSLGLWLYCRWLRLDVWAWAAGLAPAALTAIAVGRIGCFASGSHFGRELSEGAWPVVRGLGTYPRWPDEVLALGAGPPVWLAQVERQELAISRLLSNPTHPVQLYEACAVGLVVWLVSRQPRLWLSNQKLCCALGFAYAAITVALEWLRADAERGLLGPSLGVSWAMLAAALMLLVPLLIMLRGFGLGSQQRWGWGALFAVAYGLALAGIAAQLAQAHVRAVQLSLAQVLAALAALGVAMAALWRAPPQPAAAEATLQQSG